MTMTLRDIKGILKVFVQHLHEDIDAYGWRNITSGIVGFVLAMVLAYFVYQWLGLI